MEVEIEKSEVTCFLENYEKSMKGKLRSLKSGTLPMVLIAKGLRHHIMAEYGWSKENADSYVMKCKFTIAEELDENQIELAVTCVRLIFDVQMEVFNQMDIGHDVIASSSAGITFEMGRGAY